MEANKEDVLGIVMEQRVEGNQEVLAQLKGQILALEHALDTKKALQEIVQEEEEENEVQSSGSEDFS